MRNTSRAVWTARRAATQPRFLSTYSVPTSEAWTDSVSTLRPADRSRLGLLSALVRAAPCYDLVILRGAVGMRDGYVDLLAAGVIARRGTPVLVADATWEPGSRALLRGSTPIGVDQVSERGREAIKAMMKTLDHPLLHYGVLSRAELEIFPVTWSVDPARVHYTPFCATSRGQTDPRPLRRGVFAGGDSLRDYRPLIRSAHRIDAPITIGTRLRVPAETPANLFAGELSAEAYQAAAKSAAIVVVPLLPHTLRSAGQQTYLNAMRSGQAVIVTEAPGARDYVKNRETGLVVPADEIDEAVNWLLRDPAQAAFLAEGGRRAVQLEFELEDYFERLLALAQSIAD